MLRQMISILPSIGYSTWAYQFYNLGGKKLYIDEIHKYKDWSREVKNIYDQIPGLQVIYTGSSILDLEKGGADLSRRKVEYRLPGLSFREYLNISQGWQLPSYSLEEILAGKVEFPYKEARPLKLFNDYLSTVLSIFSRYGISLASA